MSNITERSQVHATFVIERNFATPTSTVWRALSDNDQRDEWFTG